MCLSLSICVCVCNIYIYMYAYLLGNSAAREPDDSRDNIKFKPFFFHGP